MCNIVVRQPSLPVSLIPSWGFIFIFLNNMWGFAYPSCSVLCSHASNSYTHLFIFCNIQCLILYTAQNRETV